MDGNPEGTLTNSNLELAALVLHEAALLETCPEAKMAAPQSVLDNTPTGASGRHRLSTWWLWTSSASACSTLASFFSTLCSSTTQDWKIAWRMTHLAYLILLTHHFLPTCLSPTRSLPPADATAFMCDIHDVQESMRAGTTPYALQQRLYRQWANLCSTL